MSKCAWNEIEWTDGMLKYLKENFELKTNQQLANALGLKLTTVRTKCYSLGLKRMDLEYWTDDQVHFLLNNYKEMGDVEIAELFNYLCPKVKRWTKKHIEKKRRYLHLQRTPAQVDAIKQRNIELGYFKDCSRKMWAKRGVSPEGSVKYWGSTSNGGRKFPVIKVNGSYVHWARHAWEQAHGTVPECMNVVFKDNNPFNRTLENLEVISNGELSRRNGLQSIQALSDNYVAGILTHGQPELREYVRSQPALIELKRHQLKLNRTIYEQQSVSEKA